MYEAHKDSWDMQFLMQHATEMKLKLNLLCEFLETENYCYPTVFKTTKVDLVTFYKCITKKFLVISS